MSLDNDIIRNQFPALQRSAIFFDNPGGTQIAKPSLDRIVRYLSECNANHEGAFATSRISDALLKEAHQAMADMLNAVSPDEIVFGANMTTLTLHISRSLSRTWHPGFWPPRIAGCRFCGLIFTLKTAHLIWTAYKKLWMPIRVYWPWGMLPMLWAPLIPSKRLSLWRTPPGRWFMWTQYNTPLMDRSMCKPWIVIFWFARLTSFSVRMPVSFMENMHGCKAFSLIKSARHPTNHRENSRPAPKTTKDWQVS
jgi:hypothetical protein